MMAVRGRHLLAALLAVAFALLCPGLYRPCVALLLRQLPWTLYEETAADVATFASPSANVSAAFALLCLEPPLCAATQQLTLYGRVMCAFVDMPLLPASKAYQRYAETRLRRVSEHHIHGCPAREPVVRLLQQRLHELMGGRQRRRWPLTLHFAGDNGVGKTRMAEAISLALAQRCGNVPCTLGDNTLELSGSSFDGLTVAQFRGMVVDLVTRHARRFPDNGVIIINELSSLDPAKTRVLMPLLGTAGAFPERMHVDLSGQIVLVTTDFGREGRTQGKNLTEMRAFIKAEFASVYSAKADAMVHTFPFLPVSLDTAAAIARMAVRDAVCEVYRPSVSALHDGAANTLTPPVYCPVCISDDAVAWLVESVQLLLPVENGRAITQAVDAEVQPLLVGHQAGGSRSSNTSSSHASRRALHGRTVVYYPNITVAAADATRTASMHPAPDGCVIDVDVTRGALALRCSALC